MELDNLTDDQQMKNIVQLGISLYYKLSWREKNQSVHIREPVNKCGLNWRLCLNRRWGERQSTKEIILGELSVHMGKIQIIPYFILYGENTSEWIKDFNRQKKKLNF